MSSKIFWGASIAMFLLACSVIVTGYVALNDIKLSDKVSATESRIKALQMFVHAQTSDKDINDFSLTTVRVGAGLSLMGFRYGDIAGYLQQVQKEVDVQAKKTAVFNGISAIGSPAFFVEKISEKSLKLYDEWVVQFDSPSAFLLKNFPRAPILAMNNEVIPFIECEQGDKADTVIPTLVWAKAYRNGHNWKAEPAIFSDSENKRWIVRYDDIEPLDTAAFERRVIAFPTCG